jgi:dethiobiotin synthetase
MRGLFVTGTDTGVGKTVLSAALAAAISESGLRVAAYKPAVTGLDDGAEEGVLDGGVQQVWPPDHELLATATGMAPEQVAPLRYGPAVSPLLASQLAGAPLGSGRLLDDAATATATAAATATATADGGEAEGTLIVEGVGGLLSPLAEDFTVCDLAVALALPLLIAARPGLGTINHSLLTLQAARAAGLDVRAVVLTPWPEKPSRLESSNAEAITRFGFVEVDALPRVAAPELAELARVGARLPWRRWLGAGVARDPLS